MIYCMNHHLLHDLDLDSKKTMDNVVVWRVMPSITIGVLFGDLDSSTNVFILHNKRGSSSASLLNSSTLYIIYY